MIDEVGLHAEKALTERENSSVFFGFLLTTSSATVLVSYEAQKQKQKETATHILPHCTGPLFRVDATISGPRVPSCHYNTQRGSPQFHLPLTQFQFIPKQTRKKQPL